WPATGIYLDDCASANGPMCVVGRTHKGPVFDHHGNGYFCGAMDPELADAGYAKAVPLIGPAGSMTIHHARLVHGSALNTSGKPRRLLLHEYTAADAWPLMGVANFDEFNSRMVLGKPTIEPRVTPVPVRMPLPPAPFQGSIYENQKAAAKRFFATAAEELRRSRPRGDVRVLGRDVALVRLRADQHRRRGDQRQHDDVTGDPPRLAAASGEQQGGERGRRAAGEDRAQLAREGEAAEAHARS